MFAEECRGHNVELVDLTPRFEEYYAQTGRFAVFALAGVELVYAVSIPRWAHVLAFREEAWYAAAVILTLLLLTIVFVPAGIRPFIYPEF